MRGQLADHVVAVHWHCQSQALEKSQDPGTQSPYRSAGSLAQGQRQGQEQNAACSCRRVDELEIHRDIEDRHERRMTTGRIWHELRWDHAWLGVYGVKGMLQKIPELWAYQDYDDEGIAR